MPTLNSGRFQEKPSVDASNKGMFDGASVRVCVHACVRARTLQGSYFEGD
jgi:hypothetical protein